MLATNVSFLVPCLKNPDALGKIPKSISPKAIRCSLCHQTYRGVDPSSMLDQVPQVFKISSDLFGLVLPFPDAEE